MTYTPGPWDIHEANDRNDAFYITHKNRRGIGSISNSFNDDGDQYTSAEDAANARLIAAAPDLLEALEESVAELCLSINFNDAADLNAGEEPDGDPDTIAIVGRAEAAIAKAKGQEEDDV
mgnify:FL=1